MAESECASLVCPALSDDAWEEILVNAGPLHLFASWQESGRLARCAVRRLQRWIRKTIQETATFHVGERVLIRLHLPGNWHPGVLSRLPCVDTMLDATDARHMWMVTLCGMAPAPEERAVAASPRFTQKPMYCLFRRGQTSVMTLRRSRRDTAPPAHHALSQLKVDLVDTSIRLPSNP